MRTTSGAGAPAVTASDSLIIFEAMLFINGTINSGDGFRRVPHLELFPIVDKLGTYSYSKATAVVLVDDFDSTRRRSIHGTPGRLSEKAAVWIIRR